MHFSLNYTLASFYRDRRYAKARGRLMADRLENAYVENHGSVLRLDGINQFLDFMMARTHLTQ